jgi:hypothetical protein
MTSLAPLLLLVECCNTSQVSSDFAYVSGVNNMESETETVLF